MNCKNRILLLNGGGLDSNSQLILLNQEKKYKGKVDSLHINYSQLSSEKEYEAVAYFTTKYKGHVWSADVLYENVFNDHPLFNDIKAPRSKFVLDGRNLMLAGVAIMFAKRVGYKKLMFGFHYEPDETFLDAQVKYVKKLQGLCDYLELDLEIIAPFQKRERDSIVKEAYALDNELFDRSWTCYKDIKCGVCSHCKQEAKIKKDLGLI